MATRSNIEDYDNPFCECEMCETMVRFNDYAEHIQTCVQQRRRFHYPMFGNMGGLMPLLVPNTQQENSSEMEGETSNDREQEGEQEEEGEVESQNPFINNALPVGTIDLSNIMQSMLQQGQQLLNSHSNTESNLELNGESNNTQLSQVDQVLQRAQSLSSFLQMFMQAGNDALNPEAGENAENEPLQLPNIISHIHFDIQTFQQNANAENNPEEEQVDEEEEEDEDMEQIPLTDFNYFESVFGASNPELLQPLEPEQELPHDTEMTNRNVLINNYTNSSNNNPENQEEEEEEEGEREEGEIEQEPEIDSFQANFSSTQSPFTGNRRATIRYRNTMNRQHIFSQRFPMHPLQPTPATLEPEQAQQQLAQQQLQRASQMLNEPMSSRMLLTLARYFPQRSDQFNDYEFNLMLGSLMGKVDRGISNMDTISYVITDEKDITDDICAVCQEDLKELFKSEVKLRKTFCKHIFCEDCITKWLEKNVKCPVCNIELDKMKENENIKINTQTPEEPPPPSGEDMV
jgi:hypothetical protein